VDDNISPCGLDCTECEAYIATKKCDMEKLAEVAEKWNEQYGGESTAEDCICDGCTMGERLSKAHAQTCKIRICADNRGVPTCAHCEDFICEMLEGFFQFAPELEEKLRALRDELDL